jgi:tetratricopeptide (TPR) repeat protein
MNFCFKLTSLLIILLTMDSLVNAEGRNAAPQLINQAQKYDIMFVPGTKASQQKALALYESALDSRPDSKQRLYILDRMAQLNGSAYQLMKGEQPDFRKAIKWYEEIINSCSPDDPLVYKAMCAISDHYISLHEFETALEWSKRSLEYNTTTISDQIEKVGQEIKMHEIDPAESDGKSLTSQEQLVLKNKIRQFRALKQNYDEITQYQKAAVEKIAYGVNFINPLLADVELKALIKKYPNSFIAEKATKCLVENMDTMSELWMPALNVDSHSGYITLASKSRISQNEHAVSSQISLAAKPLATQHADHFSKKTVWISILVAVVIVIVCVCSGIKKNKNI